MSGRPRHGLLSQARPAVPAALIPCPHIKGQRLLSSAPARLGLLPDALWPDGAPHASWDWVWVCGGAEALRPPVPSPRLFCCQGTYVLQDNSFPLLITMGSGPQYREEAPKVSAEGQDMPTCPPRLASPSHSVLSPTPTQFLAFTCGLLCGALHTLGFRSLVTASVASLPACE